MNYKILSKRYLKFICKLLISSCLVPFISNISEISLAENNNESNWVEATDTYPCYTIHNDRVLALTGDSGKILVTWETFFPPEYDSGQEVFQVPGIAMLKKRDDYAGILDYPTQPRDNLDGTQSFCIDSEDEEGLFVYEYHVWDGDPDNEAIGKELYFYHYGLTGKVKTPSRLSIKLFEIGFRDSSTGSLNPVFKDLTGSTMLDLIEYKGNPTNLINGLRSPSDGTYDQLYFITSNNPLASGNNGAGCYLKKGNYSFNDGVINGGATTNPDLAATINDPASITETGFSGSDDNYGPVTPIVTATVNGMPTSGMKLLLINDENISIKPYSKYLHYANLTTSVTIQDKKGGTLILTYNTDEAMGFRGNYSSSNPTGEGCENFYWDKLGLNLSIIFKD
tara:strand:+ start:512 stop:1696 length:1185 start_codon:yes stop_codon:yes gene_type:complete